MGKRDCFGVIAIPERRRGIEIGDVANHQSTYGQANSRVSIAVAICQSIDGLPVDTG